MQPNAEQINEDEEEDEEGDEDEEEEVPVLDPTQYELLRSAAKRFMLQFPNRHIECAYQRWRVARLVNMDGPLLFLMIVYYLFRLVGPVSSKLQWEGLTGYAFWKEFLQCCALSMVFIILTIPISRVFYLRHRELIMIIVNASLVWGCLWSWPGTWISQNMEIFSREWTASANNDSLQSIGDSLLTMIAQTSWIVTLNYVARIQYHVQLSLLGTSLVGVVAESCLTAGGTKLSWSSLPLSILPISMTLLVPCAVSYYLEYKSRELFCSSITAFRLIYHKY